MSPRDSYMVIDACTTGKYVNTYSVKRIHSNRRRSFFCFFVFQMGENVMTWATGDPGPDRTHSILLCVSGPVHI